MKIQKFKGDYFDIGKQKGNIYRQNGKSYKQVSIKKDIFLKQLKIYKKFYPELLEELEGISIGGNFDKDKLIYSSIIRDDKWLKNKKEGCSIFGLKKDKSLYIGRNYDWSPKAKNSFQIFRVESNDFRLIGVSDMWISYRNYSKDSWEYYGQDYINDFGLYIGLTYAYGNNFSFGLTSNHFIKLIAEKCRTIEEAIGLFKKIPQVNPKNFFIADKNGKMVVVEHNSGSNFKLVFPENDTLIKTNHYLNSELAKIDRVLIEKPEHDTFLRYWEIKMLIDKNKKNFNFNSIEKIMRKENRYVFKPKAEMSTIWTLSLDVKNRKYKVNFRDDKYLKLIV